MLTAAAAEAARILRNPETSQWHVIPLFAVAVYVYANQIDLRKLDLVFARLAFLGMDWCNEIWNGLVVHFTYYSPVWGTPRQAAFLILIGYLPSSSGPFGCMTCTACGVRQRWWSASWPRRPVLARVCRRAAPN